MLLAQLGLYEAHVRMYLPNTDFCIDYLKDVYGKTNVAFEYAERDLLEWEEDEGDVFEWPATCKRAELGSSPLRCSSSL